MMKKAVMVFFIAGALLLSACTTTVASSSKDVNAKEFKELIGNDEVFVLDVHTPEQSHIPGTDAVIPYNQLKTYQYQLPTNKDTPIALYCRSGSMSAEAKQTLAELGYTKVYNLIGGANEWKANGFPVEE